MSKLVGEVIYTRDLVEYVGETRVHTPSYPNALAEPPSGPGRFVIVDMSKDFHTGWQWQEGDDEERSDDE